MGQREALEQEEWAKATELTLLEMAVENELHKRYGLIGFYHIPEPNMELVRSLRREILRKKHTLYKIREALGMSLDSSLLSLQVKTPVEMSKGGKAPLDPHSRGVLRLAEDLLEGVSNV